MENPNIIVTSGGENWNFSIEGARFVTAKEYLTDPEFADMHRARVFNLCRHYRYQSMGYYVSLLAEARQHHVLPSIRTIQDFRSQTMVRSITDDLDDLIQLSLQSVESTEFTLHIFFSQTMQSGCGKLARGLYNLFPAPLLRIQFVKVKKWLIQQVRPITVDAISLQDIPFVQFCALNFFAQKRLRGDIMDTFAYDLAILVGSDDNSPPSDAEALRKFADAARRRGFYPEFINREHIGRVQEFDALLIRETTNVNHHTYRFARRAHAEGLVVVDDPWSILRCSNKVYMAELFRRMKIPTPPTFILSRKELKGELPGIPFPCILKQPDSSFSRGVIKAQNEEEFRHILKVMLETTELAIVQSFVPSDFDWRIGILDRQPLFACKYFMAKGHWQVYDWSKSSVTDDASGDHETVPVEDVPKHVLQIALRAANLIGDGFYGVDLKQFGDECVVIEVNDNPNVDSGVEDAILGDELYLKVMDYFLKKIRSERNTPLPSSRRN